MLASKYLLAAVYSSPSPARRSTNKRPPPSPPVSPARPWSAPRWCVTCNTNSSPPCLEEACPNRNFGERVVFRHRLRRVTLARASTTRLATNDRARCTRRIRRRRGAAPHRATTRAARSRARKENVDSNPSKKAATTTNAGTTTRGTATRTTATRTGRAKTRPSREMAERLWRDDDAYRRIEVEATRALQTRSEETRRGETPSALSRAREEERRERVREQRHEFRRDMIDDAEASGDVNDELVERWNEMLREDAGARRRDDEDIDDRVDCIELHERFQAHVMKCRRARTEGVPHPSPSGALDS